MTNGEKYKEEIKKISVGSDHDFCDDFIIPKILKKGSCNTLPCEQCRMLQMMWLDEECEEPEIDWSKVPVDAKILVRDYESDRWTHRHFAMYKDGLFYAYENGGTSFTVEHESVVPWKFAKLAEV